MQAKVPQDVQREDKIIGPFSLKQFLYLIAASMLGYLTFSIISKLTGLLMLGIMLGLLSFLLIAAFAVIEVQGRPLPEFMTAFIIFSLRPQKRIWQKDIFIPDIAYIPAKKEEIKPEEEPTEVKSELEKLAHVLDTRGWAELAQKEEKQEIKTLYKKYEEPEEPKKEDVEKKAAEIETLLKQEIAQKESLKKEAAKLVKAGGQEIKKENTRPKTQALKKEVKIELPQKAEPQKVILGMHQKETPLLEKALKELEFSPKSTIQIKKEVEEDLKKQKDKQKENIKKFKTAVSQIEKIVKNSPAAPKQKPAKKALLPIVSFAWPAQKKPSSKELPAEEYKIDLKNRLTTPRVLEPTTNIKVDEEKLEDVLGKTEKVKTLEKEIEEIKTALREQKTKKKPAILIKEPVSLFYKKKRQHKKRK